jgi:hypothetical protein
VPFTIIEPQLTPEIRYHPVITRLVRKILTNKNPYPVDPVKYSVEEKWKSALLASLRSPSPPPRVTSPPPRAAACSVAATCRHQPGVLQPHSSDHCLREREQRRRRGCRQQRRRRQRRGCMWRERDLHRPRRHRRSRSRAGGGSGRKST